MQQERSFLRRVKVLRPFIYENCPSSRRAYVSIRLAVKTSRPHFITKFEIKILSRQMYNFKLEFLLHNLQIHTKIIPFLFVTQFERVITKQSG